MLRAQPRVGHGGHSHESRLEAALTQVGTDLAQVVGFDAKIELGRMALAQPTYQRHVLGKEPPRHDLEVVKVGLVQ